VYQARSAAGRTVAAEIPEWGPMPVTNPLFAGILLAYLVRLCGRYAEVTDPSLMYRFNSRIRCSMETGRVLDVMALTPAFRYARISFKTRLSFTFRATRAVRMP